MGQKHKRFRKSRTPFPLRDIRKNPRSMYARVPQAIAQVVLKLEKLSHIMGPTPILEMARAYGLRPRLWLLVHGIFSTSTCSELWRRLKSTWLQVWLISLVLPPLSFVVHTKCWEKGFLMDYEAKVTEAKQARWLKPEVKRSWIYLATYSKQRETKCE